MKRTMRWMWEVPVTTLDEKGKPVKGTIYVLNENEITEEQKSQAKKVKVAHYTPKAF